MKVKVSEAPYLPYNFLDLTPGRKAAATKKAMKLAGVT